MNQRGITTAMSVVVSTLLLIAAVSVVAAIVGYAVFVISGSSIEI
jgi:hypothetical protein